MDAKELMIGDYIYDIYGNKAIVRKLEDYNELAKANGACIELVEGPEEGYTICLYGEIEPIRITPEILEKNGLNKGTWGCSDSVCYSIIDGAYQLALVQELPSYYCNIRTVSSLVNMNILIRYVHELQHALRLARIKKEIVL